MKEMDVVSFLVQMFPSVVNTKKEERIISTQMQYLLINKIEWSTSMNREDSVGSIKIGC